LAWGISPAIIPGIITNWALGSFEAAVGSWPVLSSLPAVPRLPVIFSGLPVPVA
jgi:hypothetical protein